MDSLHVKELALIRIRLIAENATLAQCDKDQYGIVVELISDIADTALDDEPKEVFSTHTWADSD